MPFYPDHLKVDDPDSIDTPLMGIAVDDTAYTHPMHQHKKGQLLFCNKGIVEVITAERYFLISPARAVWIPSTTPHKIKAKTTFSFQSLYFDMSQFTNLPKQLKILHANGLLRELIAKACFAKLHYAKDSPEFRLAMVIADEIVNAAHDQSSLKLPNDKRLKKAFSYLKENASLQATAEFVAEKIFVTPRSLSRLCQHEFGCSFEQWRQQVIIMEALVLLEQNKSINYISQKLGYNSESAFIHFFKKWMNFTPSAYKRKTEKGSII